MPNCQIVLKKHEPHYLLSRKEAIDWPFLEISFANSRGCYISRRVSSRVRPTGLLFKVFAVCGQMVKNCGQLRDYYLRDGPCLTCICQVMMHAGSSESTREAF